MAESGEGVAALVLAAGTSSRMGRNKLLLELEGEPLVRRAARTALEAGLRRVVVVLGHDAKRVKAALGALPCEVIENPDHARGAGTSVQAGLRHLDGAAEAVVVVLADMPYVTAGMIATLVERFRATRAPVVVSRYGQVQAPPTLLDRSLFREVLEEPPDQPTRTVVRRHEARAATVLWPEGARHDVDHPGDYESVRLRGGRPIGRGPSGESRGQRRRST